ncbi:MAG: DUF488 family protein [Candidatus Sulfotelmatobacter sp.]|jgi:uncharacterized protein YeaO (DUF488 family)
MPSFPQPPQSHSTYNIGESGEAMPVAVKRVYESASRSDGARVLVDRLWPRGISKTEIAMQEWLRDLAPSDELRKWFHTQPEQWAAFRKRYLKELARPEAGKDLQKLYSLAHKKRRLTLLYASKNETRNNAIVLKDLLDGMRKPPTGTGPGALRTMGKRDAAVRRR